MSRIVADPTDVASKTDDIGSLLIGGGEPNYRPCFRVRARLEVSTDTSSTPVFAGWSMQLDCIPFD